MADVVRIVYTRPDHATMAGGIIIRRFNDRYGPGEHEYVCHFFNRERGSKTPTSYHNGVYCGNDDKKANRVFSERVVRATGWDTGGSLIDDCDLDRELKKELERSNAS